MTALSLKKQPGLHVSTLVWLGIAFLLTAAILIFTFSSAWGAYIGTIEAAASSDVFKTFDLETIDGGRLSAADLRGRKLVAVNIWGTDCPPCLAELPSLESLSKEYDPDVFCIIGIPMDITSHGEKIVEKRLEEARRITKAAGIQFPNIIADPAMDSFVRSIIAGTPTTLFLDSEGNIIHSVTGNRSFDTMKEIIDSLLKER
jgi:thiol-disulfide isomerase/thioredoxin